MENKDPNKVSDIMKIEDFRLGLGENFLYIIHSTLNQAVNYIPAKLLNAKNILNLTFEENNDKIRFNNVKWDNNLQELLSEKIDNFFVDRGSYNDVYELANKLKANFEEKVKEKRLEKIVWNITGGQRPFVIAVNDLVREIKNIDHYVIYLEGNTGQMLVNKYSRDGGTEYFSLEYNISEIQGYNIETALKLMGFDFYYTEDEISNGYKTIFKKIYDEYIKNPDFRIELIKTNKKGNEELSDVLEKWLKTEDDSKIEKLFGENYHGKHTSKFGYLLEDMVYHVILEDEEIKEAIIEKKKSLKLRLPDKTTVDEFDVILLNKYGHIIIFEMKSGGMSGDVAKSTKYSTYAVSGVYGLPILITPLIKEEIENLDKLKDDNNQKDDNNRKDDATPKDNTNSKDTYDYIKSAIRAAKRAGLEVWGVDEVKENIKYYLGIT